MRALNAGELQLIHPKLDLTIHGDVTSMSDHTARQIAGWSATDVESIVAIERVRELAAARGELGEPCPVDLFIPMIGEPACPSATKIGGVPFRPAEWSWPVHAEYGPMTFVCQFNFSDSREIVPWLPGEMLLVFSGDFPPYTDEQGSCLHIEWYTPRGADVMASESNVAGHPDRIPKMYGIRYRTVDYPASTAICQAMLAEIQPVRAVPERKKWLARGCANLLGWKIGGQMPDLGEPAPNSKFICSLVDLSVSEDGSPNDVALIWYDGFTLAFTIDDDRRVQWHLRP